MTERDARDAMMAILRMRGPDATICPSEVARSLAASGSHATPTDWRDLMPIVHAATDALMGLGKVRLSWKGRRLSARYGPYRITLSS